MRPLLLLLILPLAAPGVPQARPSGHASDDPRKCTKCWAAYEKAMGYIRQKLPQTYFPSRMVIGWTLLADGRYPDDLQVCVRAALQWDPQRNQVTTHQGENWFPALAAIFLAEVYKHQPTDEIRTALDGLVAYFAQKQEKTGGWFKWYDGTVTQRSDYPVPDLGILDGIIFGFLWNVKTQGLDVPEDTLKKADACLLKILGGTGIAYGTGSMMPDKTGARGAFALLGLTYAGQTRHKIFTTYEKFLPKCIPDLDKGHHVGAFHGLGVTLGCRLLGPQAYSQLTTQWLDKLIAKQDAEGGLYIGDDGDAGGEPGLLGDNSGSTAAFALMILLQDPKMDFPQKPAPPKKHEKKPAKKK